MGKTYRHPAMKQLKDQQTRYAPRDRRLEQVERAEQLLGEIERVKRYPYDYLCYRITGVRPDGRILAPIMPWRSFAKMTKADVAALVAYLRTLPPVSNKVPGPFGPNEKPPIFVMTLVPPQDAAAKQ